MSRRANKGSRCDTCRMHMSLCICAVLPRLKLRTQLCLILHKEEARKTTNTGMLAARVLENSLVLIHGVENAPLQPTSFAGRRPLILFPDDKAAPLTPEHGAHDPVTLVVADGTWRQADKMRRRIPWLAGVEPVRLPDGMATTYNLRAESKNQGLATAEAIARALAILEGSDAGNALGEAFRVMVDRTLFSRGQLARERVTGGLPEHVFQHLPWA